MSNFTYQIWYRKYGIRLLQQLMTPVMHELPTLELPMRSIYHYVTYDGIENGPPNDDYLFRNIKKPILVSHYADIGSDKGNPRKLVINTAAVIRDYHMQHRRMRPLRNLQTAEKDPRTLIVMNYCLIAKSYRYVRSIFTEYYKWYNTFAGVMKNATDAAAQTECEQYLLCNSPKIIPSLNQLTAAVNDINQTTLKVFRDKDSFLLLELWKWLSENRAESLLNTIPANKIHLFNLVFIESGKWCVLNLGVLNSFRANTEQIEGYVIESKVSISAVQLQKRILRMLMSIVESRAIVTEDPNDVKVVSDKPLTAYVRDTSNLVTDEELLEMEKLEEQEDQEAETQELQDAIDIDTAPESQSQVVDDEEDLDPAALSQKLKDEDDALDQDLAQLNEIASKQEGKENLAIGTVSDIISEPEKSLEQAVMDVCDKLADDGLLTAAEYRQFSKLASSYKSITAPDKTSTLDTYINIDPAVLVIDHEKSLPDSKQVLDKTMLKASLDQFTKKYVKDVMGKDVAGMVLSIQRAGVAVTGYTVEPVTDIMGSYEIHTVKLKPVEGQSSTVRFKLPVVETDGSYRSNSVSYKLRLQRADVPIRKVDYNRVALTSYYGKCFINRGRKKQYDYGHWIQTSVMAKGLDNTDIDITNIVAADVFDSELIAPRAYSALSQSFKQIKCRSYTLDFDRSNVLKTYPQPVLDKYEADGNLVIGMHNAGHYLVIDVNAAVYSTENDSLNLLGSFEEFLSISGSQSPTEFAELVVFGKEIPMALVLSYHMGFTNLMKLLKVEPRRVNAGSRLNLEAHEYALAFSDETLIFSKEDRLAAIILSGFIDYHRALKMFSVYSFDKRGVYMNLLESNQLGVRYLREMDLMFQMFIDPITKDLLKEMKEPQTFQGLLFRSCEMLLNDQHPDELDPKFMRLKGYERIPGAIYSELVQSMRLHNSKMGKSSKSIELNPYAVWKRISEDPSKSQISEINPIKALKESEAVTYAGTGGRNKRSMVKSTRGYHVNDMGTISESTVDSSDVAINVFTSANPQLTGLRGLSRRFDMKTQGATSLLSTSALISPSADHDDARRVSFIAIQQEHSIACDGYHQPTIRTGYEQMIAHRSDSLFAMTAKQKGVVKSISNKGIIVEYEDKSVQGYELGRRFGAAAGLVLPHEIKTPLKAGDVIEVGDAIVYNTGFFEPDFMNPKRVTFKNYALAKTVLWESPDTLEDASAISPKIAGLLSTRTTKVKSVMVRFDQSLSKLVKVGDRLESESVLCIVEDSITASGNLFNEETLDTLRVVGAQTPRAHVKGVVEKIEVYYHGDKEDMTDSLLTIANAGDKQLKENAKALGTKEFTGSVDSGFRVENDPLGLDCMVVKIYITTTVPCSVGDKMVFGNQLKSVASSLMVGEYKTESGVPVDAMFGWQSVDARTALSAGVIGTTNTLLSVIAEKAVALYKA